MLERLAGYFHLNARRYLTALVLLALATALRMLLAIALKGQLPFSTFFIALVVTAWCCGLGPSIVVLVGGMAMGAVLFGWPTRSLDVTRVEDWIAFGAFTLVATLTTIACQSLRHERRKREETARALWQSNEHVAEILSSIMDCYFVLDRQWRFVEANAGAERYFNLTRELMIGRNLWDAMPKLLGSIYEKEYRAAMAEQRGRHLEMPSVLFPGRWVELYVAPSKERLDVCFRDISVRKRSEEMLRHSEQQLSDFFENATLGLHWVGPDGIILRANRAELEIFGYPREEFLGRHLREFHVDPSIVDGVLAKLNRGEDVANYESLVKCKDGSIKHVLVSPSVYREDGRFIHTRSFTRDVTPRRRAEAALIEKQRILLDQQEALREAKEKAEHASKAKDEFLAALSHELRTPLTPVLMTATALEQDASMPQSLREDLAMIRRNVELETKLIDDLLDLTRVTRGKLSLHPENVDVHATLHEAIENSCRSDLHQKRLNLITELLAERRHVHADAARLQQVLWNVLKNAVKFTPEGGSILVKTYNQEASVVIEVTDTGVGIEPEALPRIFNAFEQESGTISRQFGGLGLGLAISKRVVEMHGGSIVASSHGKGTGATLTVTLPTVAAEATHPARGDQAGDARSSSTSAAGVKNGRPLKILLVEDHESTARVMARLLEGLKYEVSVAGDVGSALRLAEGISFDLVVSDLGLPDGSGHDLMKQLKGQYGVKGICLSGYGMEEDVRKSLESGFAEHLTKPLNFDRFKAAVARVGGR